MVDITQFVDHVKVWLISQLIIGITKAVKNFLRYFNDTAVLTTIVLTTAVAFAVIFALAFKDSEKGMLSRGSSF